MIDFVQEILSQCGKQNSFVFTDKKLGPLLFYVVPNSVQNQEEITGTLYCSDWGRDWKYSGMERNGEQWLYRFENGNKVREYNLPKTFLNYIYEQVGIRVVSR